MKKKKVKPVKQMGSTGTKLQKEVAAMEEAMKQHHIEEQCQLLIDEMMPQIKRLGRSLSGTYHRNIIEYTTSRIKSRKVLWKNYTARTERFLLIKL